MSSAIAALVGSQTPTLLNDPDRSQEADPRHRQERGRHGRPDAHGRMASAAAAIDHTEPTAPAPNSYAFVPGVAIGSTIKSAFAGRRAPTTSAASPPMRCASRSTAQRGHGHRLDDEPVRRPFAHVLDRLPLPGPGARPGRQHRRVCRRPAGPPKLTQQNGTGVTYGGTWTSRSSSSASGGSTRYATKAGAWVQFSFTGRAVAVIAPKASRGSRRSTSTDVRRDHQRLPELVAVEDRAVRAELEHVRQPQGQARPHRDVRPSRFDIDAFGYMQ